MKSLRFLRSIFITYIIITVVDLVPVRGFQCQRRQKNLFIHTGTAARRWRRTIVFSQPDAYADADAITFTEHDKQLENNGQYNTLPRLFVGQLRVVLSTTSMKPSASASPSQQDSKLKLKSKIHLSPEQTHYLTKVMRLFAKKKRTADGDNGNDALVRVFDGINGEWLCKVIPPHDTNNQDNKKRQRNHPRSDLQLEAECLVQLREQTLVPESKSLQPPWLFFAPIKKQRAKLMVEKCTELGVELFCPVLTEFTDATAMHACIGSNDASIDAFMFQDMNTKKTNGDVEKLSLVACEAAEQSERLSVPAFVTCLEDEQKPLSVQELLHKWIGGSSSLGKDRILMVCRERTQDRTSVLSILQAMEKASEYGSSVAYLVGPEGGWSSDEESLFDECCQNHPESIMGVSLGSNVLRAETAGMIAVGSFCLWSSS